MATSQPWWATARGTSTVTRVPGATLRTGALTARCGHWPSAGTLLSLHHRSASTVTTARSERTVTLEVGCWQPVSTTSATVALAAAARRRAVMVAPEARWDGGSDASEGYRVRCHRGPARVAGVAGTRAGSVDARGRDRWVCRECRVVASDTVHRQLAEAGGEAADEGDGQRADGVEEPGSSGAGDRGGHQDRRQQRLGRVVGEPGPAPGAGEAAGGSSGRQQRDPGVARTLRPEQEGEEEGEEPGKCPQGRCRPQRGDHRGAHDALLRQLRGLGRRSSPGGSGAQPTGRPVGGANAVSYTHLT